MVDLSQFVAYYSPLIHLFHYAFSYGKISMCFLGHDNWWSLSHSSIIDRVISWKGSHCFLSSLNESRSVGQSSKWETRRQARHHLFWLTTQSNEKFTLIWWEIERVNWMTTSPIFLDVIKIECASLASYFVVSHPDLPPTLSKSSCSCLRYDHRLSWHWDNLSHSSIVSSDYSTGSQRESRISAE